jgi:hypothetical protein
MAIVIQMKDANYAHKIALEPVLRNQLYAEMDNVTPLMVKPAVIAAKTVDYAKPTVAIDPATPGKTVNLVLMIVVFVLL